VFRVFHLALRDLATLSLSAHGTHRESQPGMSYTESPSMRALHLRDYFWLQYSPAPGDEKAWRKIECAGIRIAETIGFMLGSQPDEDRRRAARRVRRAARECLRLIPTLRAFDDWTLRAARDFEILADAVLAQLEPPSADTTMQ
jgi:hypothetical protein